MRAPKQRFRTAPPALHGSAARLARRLQPHLRRPVALTLTDNANTMIAVRRDPGRLTARVHHMFARAPEDVVRALAAYLETNADAPSRVVGDYIDRNQRLIRRARPGRRRSAPLSAAGEHHDILRVFDDLNRSHFGGRVRARIAWGPRVTRGPHRRSMKLGSYAVEERLIRVHPALDRAFVPAFFVAWIVHHEMLHAVHDIPRRNGRRVYHTAAFLADERRFPDTLRARRWERENVDRLLDY